MHEGSMQTILSPAGAAAARPFAMLQGRADEAATTRSEGTIETLGPVRAFAKDAEIYAEGDRAVFFYKVLSGAVRTCKLLSDGRRQIDAFHLPGDIFGLEARDEHRFCAEAVSDAHVVVYRRSSLESLASTDAQFARQIVSVMMGRLAQAQEHTLLLGRKTALERIATFLLDMAERASADADAIALPMLRSDIADYLGLTIETVSRTLTQLEREAVIELAGCRRIVLRDKAALRRLNG
jgi:CRP/FNR family nitrogen fixation transcriptional regulator